MAWAPYESARSNVIVTDVIDIRDDRGLAWHLVAEVVDAMETEIDLHVDNIEDRVMALLQATSGESSAAFHEALRRGVSAVVREALARLRFDAALPDELPPGMIELARGSRCGPAGRADAWLVGREAFWDRFQLVAEQTLADAALCWEVIKVARVRLRDHSARLSALFRRACERELRPIDGFDEDPRLPAVLRALDGQWVEPGELGYDLASHHTALVADTPRSVEMVARRTERPLLRVQGPDGAVWGWLGGPTRMSEADLNALITCQDWSDARVAFGEPAEGVAGFAASHHQALEASAIAVATHQRAVRFADCRVLIAVLRDDDLAKGIIARELGELDRPNDRMRELREALRAYLEHSQNVSATAALLRRDRKTIERQLRSVEQLIHHPVSERSDAVLIALRVAEIMQGDRSGARRGRRASYRSPDEVGWMGHNRRPDGRAQLAGVPDLPAPSEFTGGTRVGPGYRPGVSDSGPPQAIASTDTGPARVPSTDLYTVGVAMPDAERNRVVATRATRRRVALPPRIDEAI